MSDNKVTYQRLLRQAEEGMEQVLRAVIRARELVTDHRQAEKLEEARAKARMLQNLINELVTRH